MGNNIEGYKFEECFYHQEDNGVRTIRCPECKNHGDNINSRGDCKNLIKMPDGHIAQCQCYSKEHK